LNSTDKGTPPRSKTQKNLTHDTWDNVRTSERSHENASQGSLVGEHPSLSGRTPNNISDCQETISKASEIGSSSPITPEISSPTMLRRNPEDSNSTDKALVVLTDLRHDPLYGKIVAHLQKDARLGSEGETTLGENLCSSIDLPSTQWSSRQKTAVFTSRGQENIRTIQQSGEYNQPTRTVHPAKRSRRALEGAGLNPGTLQDAIPSLLDADAFEDQTGVTGNPGLMDSIARPVLSVESSNIRSPRYNCGITDVSTAGEIQQSPILG